MKRIIIIGFLISSLILVNSVFSQGQEMSRQDFLQKSKNQKTAAWILLGGGVILETVGILQAGMDDMGTVVNGFTNALAGQNVIEDSSDGTALMIVGGAAMLGSIPLFVSASNNRQKAYSVSFKSQPLDMPRLSSKAGKNIPALTISIPLK